MAGAGFSKVGRDGLRGDAAERLLFLELCSRAAVKACEEAGVPLSCGQLLVSIRELGEVTGKNPMFVLRHLRKLRDAGLLEMKQVTLPFSSSNGFRNRMLVTITELSEGSVITEAVRSEGGAGVKQGVLQQSVTAECYNNALCNKQKVNNLEAKEVQECYNKVLQLSETTSEKSGEKSKVLQLSETIDSPSNEQEINDLEVEKNRKCYNEVLQQGVTTSLRARTTLSTITTFSKGKTSITSSPAPLFSALQASDDDDEMKPVAPRYVGNVPRRAARGRLIRHDTPKTNTEGEKTASDAEMVQVLAPRQNKPEMTPQNEKSKTEAVETELRQLMTNDQVRFQLNCKSGGMDEATAASLIPEFAGQIVLEGKENDEHGMRLALHFGYWLRKKKSFLDKEQKHANKRQQSADADRRDLELLYSFMHS